jgi:hypothetical protein
VYAFHFYSIIISIKKRSMCHFFCEIVPGGAAYVQTPYDIKRLNLMALPLRGEQVANLLQQKPAPAKKNLLQQKKNVTPAPGGAGCKPAPAKKFITPYSIMKKLALAK